MPRVLNKRTDKIPLDAVYVGRPSKWGNPFKVYPDRRGGLFAQRVAIDAYRKWLLTDSISPIKDIEELRGKDLVCWCSPLPCHADVLLELANV